MTESSPTVSASDRERAQRRSWLGIKFGPGSLLVALVLGSVMGAIGMPGVRWILPLQPFVWIMVGLAHVMSLTEALATLRALRYRPLPRSVVLLDAYWIGLVGLLIWGLSR